MLILHKFRGDGIRSPSKDSDMLKKSITYLAVLCSIVLFCSVGISPSAPKDEKVDTIYCGIAFYNLENIFDTIHDEGKNDYDFLPEGSYHWNTLKYTHKVRNMARVLSQLCTERVRGGAAFIGVSEVENSRVLDDLIADSAIAAKGLKYIHYEGEDRRGVDVACLYNPRMFKPTHSELLPAVGYEEFSNGHRTRGILHVEGSLFREHFHFLVNHWPSRGAGSESREFMGKMARHVIDSIRGVEPDARIVLMGDLNDDPDDVSVTQALGAQISRKKVEANDLYNPWYFTLRKEGQGTLLWDGMWNLFDQIIVTSNLLGEDRSTWKFFKNEIFMADYMISTRGRNKGGPLRTTSAGVWLDGYSDHFPTQIYLSKAMPRQAMQKK